MSAKHFFNDNPYFKAQGLPPSKTDLIFTASGCFVAIGVISFLSLNYSFHLLVASFGASALLLFGAPSTPMAQPRNVIGGHVLSALIGVGCYRFFGDQWFGITLAVTLAIVVMLATNTGHPPGGATALVAVTSHANLSFIIAPILLGAIFLVLVAVIVNHFAPGRQYPLGIEKKLESNGLQATESIALIGNDPT